ncbi:MAG: sugar ABC transporter permease [Chloroflexi bacterium]|nr:sugar ABC transporter permease [Chloroflexota bacterium]MXX51684.1 sugar ABC transporter permease [Chloroflexota bacterium]MXX83481.1 sugar ABC transporter permease [Chloroflexota bacterium]MYA94075.1 sugar ABC transporter permease [Chloroflexota bacterium]MYC56739.1 sugar ABC transporter permease [Chloroflexota bacterium]
MTTAAEARQKSPLWVRWLLPADAPLYQRYEAIVGWLMAFPALLVLTIFLVIPFLMAFVMSFTNQRLVSPNPTEWVGMRNFERLLTVRIFTLEPERDESGAVVWDDDGGIAYPRLRTFTRKNPEYPELNGLREFVSWQSGENRTVILAADVVFLRALINTLLFAGVIAPLQGGLALLLALLLNQALPFINVFRAIYFAPVVVSMVVVSLLWRFIYDGENGLLNTMLGIATLGSFQPVDWLGNPYTAMPAMIAMSAWQAVGFHMVIWLSGLQTIPNSLYEAAGLDGAGAWQKFRYVTWPGLRNTAVLVLIVISIQAMGLFVQVDVMTRGGPLDATQSVVYQAVQRGYDKQDIAEGSAISVVLFVVVLVITIVNRYLTRDRE